MIGAAAGSGHEILTTAPLRWDERAGYGFATMRSRISLAALAAGVLTAWVPAQLAKGTAAPSFDFAKTWNDAPVSFAELKGKLVMLDFFATW